jgi:hypothetical protein
LNAKDIAFFCMSGFAVLQIRSEIRSCSGLLWAEQWPGTRSGVQAGATPGSAFGCSGLLQDALGCSEMTEKSVTIRFLWGYIRGLLPQVG